uniref:Uncharacterized protein n=1 Tax=Oryza sativa subsp. japonica TaxID=39947 RepID=Q7EZW4_ORYSJ|nr:hypothetical protein [Oryza sativa Japonica Group]
MQENLEIQEKEVYELKICTERYNYLKRAQSLIGNDGYLELDPNRAQVISYRIGHLPYWLSQIPFQPIRYPADAQSDSKSNSILYQVRFDLISSSPSLMRTSTPSIHPRLHKFNFKVLLPTLVHVNSIIRSNGEDPKGRGFIRAGFGLQDSTNF